MRSVVLTLVLVFIASLAEAAYLYRIMMVRAAPGGLTELIDLFKETMPAIPPDERPFWMRHSQGDQWDLLLVYPVESFTKFYYAESADLSAEDQEAAAKAADFEGADRIGAYLRSLMAEHHDTLAVPVK